MTVICNATPLINFAAINRLDILKEVFGQVIIPQAVYDETTVAGFLWSQFINLFYKLLLLDGYGHNLLIYFTSCCFWIVTL